MHLSKNRISELLAKSAGKLRATIYLPTHPSSSPEHLSQDRINFKNAVQALRRHDAYDERELGEVVKRVESELYENLEFWKHLEFGLMITISRSGYDYFLLPFPITEQLYVADEFIVSPLILMSGADLSYYLLDINLTEPKLWYGARDTFKKLEIEDMPKSFEEETENVEFQRQLQHQRKGANKFHGHDESEAITDNQKQYIKRIAMATDKYLAEHQSDQPLILSGTVNRISEICNHLQYRPIIDSHLVGNFEGASTKEAFDRSSPLARDYSDRQTNDQVKRLLNAAPEFVAMGTEEIITAARENRIEALYLPIYEVLDFVSGDVNNPSLVMRLPADIYDIEPMVSQVFQQNGQIIPVEIGRYEGLDQPKALCRF